MEDRMQGEVTLSDCQIQAARLNKLEYRRLERNINFMHDDLQHRLARLKRQAQYLKYHYTNVVKVVKPNRRYQLWKQTHAYEIKQAERKDMLESIQLKQKSEYKTHRQLFSQEESTSESLRPLLLLHDNTVKEPTESTVIDFSENFLRPTTSSNDRHRVYPSAMRNEYSSNSNHHLRSKSSKPRMVSFLPLPTLEESQRCTLKNSTRKDTCRTASQNQTVYKSIGKNDKY